MIYGYTQSPREVRARFVSYDCYLREDETLIEAEVTVSPPKSPPDVYLMLDAQAYIVAPDNRKVELVTRGGEAPLAYKVLLLATSSTGRKREIRFDFSVREP